MFLTIIERLNRSKPQPIAGQQVRAPSIRSLILQLGPDLSPLVTTLGGIINYHVSQVARTEQRCLITTLATAPGLPSSNDAITRVRP